MAITVRAGGRYVAWGKVLSVACACHRTVRGDRGAGQGGRPRGSLALWTARWSRPRGHDACTLAIGLLAVNHARPGALLTPHLVVRENRGTDRSIHGG